MSHLVGFHLFFKRCDFVPLVKALSTVIVPKEGLSLEAVVGDGPELCVEVARDGRVARIQSGLAALSQGELPMNAYDVCLRIAATEDLRQWCRTGKSQQSSTASAAVGIV